MLSPGMTNSKRPASNEARLQPPAVTAPAHSSWGQSSARCRVGVRREAAGSELLREAKVESAPWSELWREHTNAGTVADFMDAVEDIDHVEAHRCRLGLAVPFEFMGDAGIHLREDWKLARVGKAASQLSRPEPAAVPCRVARWNLGPKVFARGVEALCVASDRVLCRRVASGTSTITLPQHPVFALTGIGRIHGASDHRPDFICRIRRARQPSRI